MQKNGPSFSRGTEVPLERNYIVPALVQTFTKHSKLYLTAAEAKHKRPHYKHKTAQWKRGSVSSLFLSILVDALNALQNVRCIYCVTV